MSKSITVWMVSLFLTVGSGPGFADQPASSGCPATGVCAASGACASGACASEVSASGICASGVCADAGGQCASGACATVASDASKECPIATAMKQLPQMTYAVGEQNVCCPDAAKAMASQSGQPLKFVVCDKGYETEGKAKLALAEATEQFVSAFAEPKVCQQSGQVTVAGKSHCCEKMAAETAKMVKEAMAKIEMTYQVGEQSCHCPVEAKQLAQDSGKDAMYVVAGEKTCCSVEARINLARARYRSAVEAMAKANAAAEATSPVSASAEGV